ncbi:hypothetical protein K2173_021664 [Erythroxylum novogranatense]|uniref:C2 NT-type domain-containing protein n=1 Tax=Erythroxylum novogranatense TaxID=1862640 RepID=A0AAV8TGZ6_9ROSI|nr:hypothetical protein K2173_021664 [Erythroxylum novogranatense]
MFRSARWRSEKNKIKAVFKLQFHATQVAELNVNTLVVSVVPGDVGRPTAKVEKGVIREGTCQWQYPVYETVKFVRDAKTGKINERMYHFIVSSGSPKNNLVGEISVDFANYAWAAKASTVSLPLKNSKSNIVLHVSIHRLQADIDQREMNEPDDSNLKPHSRSLNTLLSNGHTEENLKTHSPEDGLLNNTPKIAESNGCYGASSGSDITMSSSESSSGLTTPRELGPVNNSLPQDHNGFLSSRTQSSAAHKTMGNALYPFCGEHQQSECEWSTDSDHGVSADDSTSSSHSILAQERPEQGSHIEIEKLKAEVDALARQVDVSELELQTLRKQIVKERNKGQDLTKEAMCFKEERDAFKEECEQLKAFQKRMEESKNRNKLQFDGGDPKAFMEEIRQELTYEKDLNASLRLQLQKTQESNAELILAVKDLDEMLEQKSREIFDLSNKLTSSGNATSRIETDDDEEQKVLEELVKEHRDAKESYVLEQKVVDLCNEIEIYRRDKDELEIQLEQLALDYEILKQENHDMSIKLEQSQLQEQLKLQYECAPFPNINELEANIESLENELQKQSKEYTDALSTIKELETHIKCLEEDFEKQAEVFEVDLEAVTSAKIVQEQRAIQAEEALRQTRWKNANTAEKLQEEFKKLSTQVANTFDANEKVAMKALAEANELRAHKIKLERMLQKVDEDIQSLTNSYEEKVHQLSDQLNSKVDQIEKLLAEIDDKSKQLELLKKQEEEHAGAFSHEIVRLQDEVKRLTMDKNHLSEQAQQVENMRVELEQMQISVKHAETLVQRGNVERNEVVSAMALLKEEAQELMEELNRIKRLNTEKETSVSLLQAEVEALRVQCKDLKHALFEDEQEKEKLRKQVFQLKSELKKKDEALASLEKKLKESNKRAAFSDGAKTPRNKSAPVFHGTKEVASLKEKIKLLEGQIKLKEMALETSTLSFLEKERELKRIVEELESRVEELNQSDASLCSNPHHQFVEQKIGNAPSLLKADTVTNSNENASNGNGMLLVESNQADLSEKEKGNSDITDIDVDSDELQCELESLKERNRTMEGELKEMQERYSEISLKFAEVEGERQKLVMSLRNLKNAKKI